MFKHSSHPHPWVPPKNSTTSDLWPSPPSWWKLWKELLNGMSSKELSLWSIPSISHEYRRWWCQNIHPGDSNTDTWNYLTPQPDSCLWISEASHPDQQTLLPFSSGRQAHPEVTGLSNPQSAGQFHFLCPMLNLHWFSTGLCPFPAALHPLHWWLQIYTTQLLPGEKCRQHSPPVPAVRPFTATWISSPGVCGLARPIHQGHGGDIFQPAEGAGHSGHHLYPWRVCWACGGIQIPGYQGFLTVCWNSLPTWRRSTGNVTRDSIFLESPTPLE